MNPTSYDNVLIKVKSCLPLRVGAAPEWPLPWYPAFSLLSGSLKWHISAEGPPWFSSAARQTWGRTRSSCGSSGQPSWSPSPTHRWARVPATTQVLDPWTTIARNHPGLGLLNWRASAGFGGAEANKGLRAIQSNNNNSSSSSSSSSNNSNK